MERTYWDEVTQGLHLHGLDSRENERACQIGPPHKFNRDAQSKCPLSEEQPSPAAPPPQVIMTNNSLPESPTQIDVGGFAFAVAGTPQSQPCTEKVLSTCLVPLLIPGL